jgi:glycosyltransferase involved in cell wall biosynthesis
MKKIAIVSYHFYKTKTRGGEIHAVLLSKLLQDIAKVTVITTQSKNHLTWKNEIKKNEDYYQNIKIIRHPVDFEIKPRDVTNFNHYLLRNKNHTIEEEMSWIKQIGPYSTSLFNYLKKNKDNFDIFIFVGYANPITYFGLPLVKDKALLIPLCHKEPRLYFKIFSKLFMQPVCILPNTRAEAEIIKKRFTTNHSPLYILGINIDETKKQSNIDIKKRFHLNNPYIIFIGRTEPYKGIYELIDYFNLFIKNNPIKLDLVIIGEKIFPIKTNRNIKYLGIVPQEEKISLIKNSLFLINPSWYESLSLTLLEAWQQKKPVLVYGNCQVLKDQVTLSSGGLSYENYREFDEKIKSLLINKDLRKTLGENGYLFYEKNYSESSIKKKLIKIINNFYLVQK